MRPLGPLLMILVCSIFDTTFELPNHVTHVDESRNHRLNFLHHKEHAMTSRTQFDIREHAKTSRKQFDVKEHAETSEKQLYVKEHAQTNGKQFYVKEHAETNGKQFYVKEHAETNGKQFYVKEHAKSSRTQFDLKEYVKTRRQFDVNARDKREVSQVSDPCAQFQFKEGSEIVILKSPKDNPNDTTYSSNITCITKISARESERVVVLTSVGKFKMEGQYPKCENDYLEYRDGEFGYALPVRKFCGEVAPVGLVSSGPNVWLKFHSDDSIEREGFQIRVTFQPNSASRKIPASCQKEITGKQYDEIGSHSEDVKECREESPNSLDIQWRIETPPNTSIFLNFTGYKMALPNDCESNLVQVFGAEPDFDHNLVHLCGSKSTPVTTKLPKEGLGPSNIMYVRMYASKLARETKFSAQFTAFRILAGQETCDKDEFDCEDGTCIDAQFRCNHIVNCRLKIDEECQGEETSALKEPHVYVMLSIFSVVLFAASVFFLYTCIRKLYRDHQYIKEQLQAKSQDHLDQFDDQLSFDSDGMDRLSVPGDSPERDNEANNYTRQMNGRKSGSVSDLLQLDSPLDGDNDWPESTPILTDEIETKYKSRPRRSNTSKNRKDESPKIKISKEEDRKEAEYKNRPRRSDAGNRKESLRTETTKEEKGKAIENKHKRNRRKSNKKEDSPETMRPKEKCNETEYTDRSKHDKSKDELSRTNTLKEDHKQIEHKSRPRREANKKEQSPKLKESKEELWEVKAKGRPRRDTNKKEQLLTPTVSKEDVFKDIEVKGRPRRDTNKKGQLLTPKASIEEVSKEIEDKVRPRQDISKKEESLRSRTTKENVNTGNQGSPILTSKKEESLRTKSSEELKDASVGTPNTMEFGCQTRESLFLTDPVTSSDGTNSSSNSRGLSAFVCSSATIVRPSSPSPAPVTTSHVTIDLQVAPREPTIHADRRPISSETTRSAPDVIIVAKRLS